MKMLCFITWLILASQQGVLAEELIYKVVPNKDRFPFPSMLPDVPSESRDRFDWKRYVNEATSPADKAYRARLAPDIRALNVPHSDDSNADEGKRCMLAADELAQKCAVFEAAYRKRLASQPETLKVLESFIQQRTQAIHAEMTLVGGSWNGSGGKAAREASRMTATLDYLESLRGLMTSLHFQDMPELTQSKP